MKEEKTLRYYLFVYLLSLGGLFVYLSYQAWRNGGYDEFLLTTLIWIPFFVTLFVFVFDKISSLFKPKTKKNKANYERYLEIMANEIDQKHELLVEDFRKLKESDRFQKGLHQAYQILENGETKDLNFDYIIKKYPKHSIEYEAMNTVIEKTKEYKERIRKEES
jgi:uncharacterized membrane protein